MFSKAVLTKVILFLFGSLISDSVADLALEQLPKFKNGTNGPIGIMTSGNGAKIEFNDISALNSPLISNELFVDSMTHFVRERIPERILHPKGAGAFGYFQVTHNVTDICKAKLFSNIGKKTPLAVRFSSTILEKGGPDIALDSRGFALKFYTEDGNFDLISFNTPMFMNKDPNVFQSAVKNTRRNPVTNLLDLNMTWDFMTLRPEIVFFFIYLLAGYGIPNGFRHMPGYSIHTYQIYNEAGESFFARFHIIPDQGVENILANNTGQFAAGDMDCYVRDLYEAISRGDFPSWTVSLQVLTLQDVKNAEFDVFDLTKILPLNKYLLRPVGKIVLNENPKNYFADVELLAFGPYNLVPGILGAPDKMFEARRFAYRDAQLYRLGANFNNIHVNCPLSKIFTYNRDGSPPVKLNGEDAPMYYPNSFNGPIPYVEKNRPKLISVTHDQSSNFDQLSDMYNEMPKDARNRLVEAIVFTMKDIEKNIQERAIKMFTNINKDLGHRISEELGGSKNITNLTV